MKGIETEGLEVAVVGIVVPGSPKLELGLTERTDPGLGEDPTEPGVMVE